MKKRTSTTSRNNLSIIALSLMLGFMPFIPILASNDTSYERSKIQTSEIQKPAQIKNSAKVTKNKNEEKQEKVNVILNGDTVVSYAAIGNDTTDLSEESRKDSVSVTNVKINGKNVEIDKDDIDKIFSISERLENIVYTLGNSTFGSIIGVLIGLVVAVLAIVFVVFVLGFPIWIVLFILWLYKRIKRNREDQRKNDKASFAYREDQETSQYSDNDSTNDSTNDFSQNLNRSTNDNNYREAIIAANNMIESSIVQIFSGLGVGFFLFVFISSPMGIAIGGLIVLLGVGKYMSGKQRLKNIKEYRSDRENYYSPNDNQRTERAEQEGQKEQETNQQDQSVEDVTPQKIDTDNRQQL